MATVWFIGDQTGKVAPLQVKLGRCLVSVTGWYRDEASCIDYFAECVVADPKAMRGLSVQSEEVTVEIPDPEPSKPRRGKKRAAAKAAPEPDPPAAAEPDQASLFG